MDSDMINRCRGCLINQGDMMSLFNANEDIFKTLIAFASVSLAENDGGPSNICCDCHSKLCEAVKFKEMCEDADKKIQQFLKQSQHGTTAETFFIKEEVKSCTFLKDNLKSKDIKVECQNICDDEYQQNFPTTDFDSYLLDDLKDHLSYEIAEDYEVSNKVYVKKVKDLKHERKRKKRKKKEADVVSSGVCPKKRGRPPKVYSAEENGKELICAVCKKVFHNLKNFEKHKNGHNIKREFSCDVCGKQFKYRDNLKVLGLVPYICTPRSRVATCKNKTHSMTHSGEKPYKCDMCGRTFSKKDNLQIHIRRHLKQREWSCETCGLSYYTSYELKAHKRTHTGEKPHVCTLCGKRFTAKNNLYIHLRTHTGEKPHVCTVCGKQFTSKNILTIHGRTHTGEKPYICSVCGKRFTANKLAVHMRTHTGEKPHICSLCGKQFSAANVLMIHMRRHTGEKPYDCKVCGQRYGHTQSLNKHMRKQHKINTNEKQLKMKQINEAHQAYLKSKEFEHHLKDVSEDHSIVIKPLVLNSVAHCGVESVPDSMQNS